MSWDASLFDLDGYQSAVAELSEPATADWCPSMEDILEQVFPEEHMRQEWQNDLQDLQKKFQVDLAGREAALDERFRALNETISQKFDALNNLIHEHKGAAAPPPRPPRLPSPCIGQRTEANSLGELEADLAMAIRPHYAECRGSNREKLSSIQRAFFLWKLDVLHINGN